MPDLFVLRHAKSSWDDPALDDIDRPLNPRGRRSGVAIRDHIAAAGICPALVLCSAARRTRETLDLIRPALVGSPAVVEEGLYGAEAGHLVARLRQVAAGTAGVLLIGHNPALEDLIMLLADPDRSAGGLLAMVREKVPTGALATLALADGTDWPDLGPGRAALMGFVRPRDLGVT